MSFPEIILDWYRNNKRDLPWRRTKDPYRIWVSEIILQQTRIDQGIGYYRRFIQKFKDVAELARADEEDILKLWQGLGYYSRARNMHAAARDIVSRYHGKFPGSYEEILKLKGIGEYTAAAIASLAFDLPYPVVEGNVLRFFARYFGFADPVDSVYGKKKIYRKALQFLDASQPGTYNQAIMEFGALQCRPGKPDCLKCPLREGCYAFQTGNVEKLPVKSKVQKPRKRYFHYLVFIIRKNKGNCIYLRKRESNDIWRNLYDFPLIETDGPVSLEKLIETNEWKQLILRSKFHFRKRSELYKHILSHQIILARFYFIEIPVKLKSPFLMIPIKDLNKYPVPRLIDRVLKNSFTEVH
jgi:A/G-specific adenine glycosylase